jgi:hypothetical protein
MVRERMERVIPLVASGVMACAAAFGWGGSAYAGGTVTGHARFEKIKGRPYMGYAELYESNLFLSPSVSPPTGPSRRLGAPGTGNTYDGFYTIDNMPAGTYSILVNQPLFFVRPKVVTDVHIQDGQTTIQNVELPVDFSTYTYRDVATWTNPDTVWYQTFTATGTSVTGVDWVNADDDTDNAEVAILKDNGMPDLRNWQVLGTRTLMAHLGAGGDHWVRWRSGEIPLVAGTRYAVRLKALGGDGRLQPYRRDKDTDSYVGGRAYNSAGVAQNFDLCLVVFADNDGTRVTMNKRTMGIGALRDGNYGQRWGQTFVAQGTFLAGVDVWAAGADNVWDLDFTWKVRVGGPTGLQIGSTKRTKAAYQSFGSGLHGVSYSYGEIPVVAGQTYFVEFANYPGFNPYVMDDDSFPQGIAYQDNTPRSDVDLNMTILEYTTVPAQPFIIRQPESIIRSVKQGEGLPDDSFTIQNAGAAPLHYVINNDASWLNVVPGEGTCAGETDILTIHYDVGSLPPGTYVATLAVSDPSAMNNPQTVTVAVQVGAYAADLDADGDVDLADFTLFQLCFNGPNRPPTANCTAGADFDHDNDVDLGDFIAFQVCFNGPNRPPACR